MSERRLRDGDDFAGRLLRAGLGDSPHPRAAAKVAAGLALASAANVSAASTAANAAASSVGALAGAGPTAGGAVGSPTTLFLLKSFAAGVLAGTAGFWVLSTISEMVSPRDGQAPAADRTETRSTATTPSSRQAEHSEPLATPSAKVPVQWERIAVPTPAATPRAPTVRGSQRVSPTPRTAFERRGEAPTAASSALAAQAINPEPESHLVSPLTVTEEVTIVDRTRAALSGGQPAEALRLLDEHQSRMKTLWVEAQVLRVEALARGGNRSAARALGERFIGAFPGTAHAARVRELLQER
jgi:hypothetical protein